MTYQFPNAVIQIFCKAPIPGQVKTRLTPELTAIQAAQVHQQLSIQAIELAILSNLCPVQLWCSPDIYHHFFQQMIKRFPITLFPQSSGDLGNRMYAAILAATQNYHHVLIIGCDSPSLSNNDLKQGLQALSTEYDTVLAPAEDGGYCLIGTNFPQKELFTDISWGGEKVLQQTREKIITLGNKCLELKEQWDVDFYQDYLRYNQIQ